MLPLRRRVRPDLDPVAVPSLWVEGALLRRGARLIVYVLAALGAQHVWFTYRWIRGWFKQAW